MIWDNDTYHKDLGWDFSNNWTRSGDPNYLLPILQNIQKPTGVDALHLNKTHEVNAIANTGGMITVEKLHYGKSVSSTITGTVDSFTDNEVDKKGALLNNEYGC